jgi:hypothetical protein
MQAEGSKTNITWLAQRRFWVLAGWLLVVTLLMVTYAAGLSVHWSRLLTVTDAASTSLSAELPDGFEAGFTGRLGPAEAEALQSLGLSLRAYAAYRVAFDVALALASLVMGVLIFWRRPDDWLALWVSLILVLLGTNSVSPFVQTLASVWPNAAWVSLAGGFLGMTSNVYLLFLSPDGRAVPRWTLRVAGGFALGLLALGLYVLSQAERWGLSRSFSFIVPVFPVWIGVLGLGVWSQVYRFRHISGPVQRQQTKWMAVGLGAVTLGFIANALFLFGASGLTGRARVAANLASVPVVYGFMLLMPICLGVAVLRYRLWDIDVIIRRTLIYASLTATLAAVYLGGVVLLQALFQAFTGQRQSEFVTVVTTLGIAALFGPLRRRLQDSIDRRFFRRKYDAARTLAEFAVAARDEVDLDRLSAQLIDVVEGTMQPEKVSLWLRPTPP